MTVGVWKQNRSEEHNLAKTHGGGGSLSWTKEARAAAAIGIHRKWPSVIHSKGRSRSERQGCSNLVPKGLHWETG